MPQRMEQLEHDTLAAEAGSLLEEAKSLGGHAARENEAILQGRLGEILFNSGKVAEASESFQAALTLCRKDGDVEGELAYLSNLLEVHRYQGEIDQAISIGEELLRLNERHGRDTAAILRRVERLRQGEPLCRIVCVHDGTEWELDEISGVPEGRYQFQFCRNRLELQMASALVRQGNALASDGQLADALEKYQEAANVDSYNPDPHYQSGMCLLELGAYSQAKEAFEECERLAPGWFHCRSDIWLAQGLDDGTISDEEFRLLRVLEDGGLNPAEALRAAQQAVERFPEFAPLYLALGDALRNSNETETAIEVYRAGLNCAAEPDVESRLAVGLASVLPTDSPDRTTLIERTLSLKGNLVAQASARLMQLL